SRSGVVLPSRLLVSVWVPPGENVQAVDGCGMNLPDGRTTDPLLRNRCPHSPWLEPGSIPGLLEIRSGQEVSFRLDPGWRVANLQVQAAPADANYALGTPIGARSLHEQSAVTDIAVVPIELEPGSYLLRIDLW